MSAGLAINHILPIDLGVDIEAIYRRASHTPDGRLPTFVELYETYTEMFVELRTNLQNKQIDHELLLLRDRHSNDIFSVENGFLPEEFGVSKQLNLFDALMFYQLCFVHDDNVRNQPVVEVW
jgi:hypothetical protein